MPATTPNPSRERQHGLMLLALLLTMLLGAIFAAAAVDVWATTRRHEREVQLLYVGDQYRLAIRRYYYAAPAGQARTLPARLEDLLEDTRYTVPVRHLRQLYPDPVTDGSEWGVVRFGAGIAGVYSLSQAAPLKQTGFDGAYSAFEAKSSYRDWVFQFVPPRSLRR